MKIKNYKSEKNLSYYHSNIQRIYFFLFGKEKKYLPESIESCKALLNYYKEEFNVI